ncbi:hypothetical protein ABZ934_24400 [Streptomyces sp. NPDC046557]
MLTAESSCRYSYSYTTEILDRADLVPMLSALRDAGRGPLR